MERAFVLAKQVLSQLSYTPTVGVPFILKHLPLFPNPFLRIFIETVQAIGPRTDVTVGRDRMLERV